MSFKTYELYVHLQALLLNSVELPHYRHQLTVKVRKQCTLEIMSVNCYCEKKSTRVRKLQLKLKRKQQLQLICGFVACLHVLIYGVIKVTTYQHS